MQKENLVNSKFPMGSEWRRWDLHIHTPESMLGNSFPGSSWDHYVSALEDAAVAQEIAVVGVTDYMSIDGYEKLYKAQKDKDKPRLQSILLLVPNIELRALPNTADGKALNIHLLIDPSDPTHIQKIRRALKNLKIKYGPETYGCSREELIEYGKAQDKSLADDAAAYKFGIEQFKPSYDQIKDWLSTEGWLKSNCLIGVSNGKDGISGLPLDGFSAIRDDLLKMCQFVFSGNPNDRQHYLGKKAGFPENKIKELYNSLKPCLHGSDAHEIANLFKPNEDRFCWIKADPTFEGLRQVIWEPEARIHVGAGRPQLSDASRIISSLDILDSHGWFTQETIPLNPGLVAIIGEKGSGKTAVADLIAFGAGFAIDQSSQSSFITKGRLHLAGTRAKLVWGVGGATEGVLTETPHATQRPLVRYLSQDFVERLCSADHQGKELQEAIEEVVFSHLDEVHREAFSSFHELRAAREAASQTKQDSFRGQLATAHREIERLHITLAQRPTKEALKKQFESQLNELKKQLPAVQILADQEILKKLNEEQATLEATEKVVAEKARQRRLVDDLLKSYQSIKERTDRQLVDLLSAAQNIVPTSTLERLKPNWDDSVESEIAKLVAGIDAEIEAFRGIAAVTTSHGKSITEITERVKALQEQLSKDDLNRKRLLDLQKQVAMQEASIQRLSNEIDDISGKVSRQLQQKERDRDELYIKYFATLAEDEKGLRELYAPMKEALDALGAEMKFELSAGYSVETKAWLEKANRFYDGRKPQATVKKDQIEKYVADTLTPAWKSGDISRVRNAFQEFVSIVNPVEFVEKHASPSGKLVDLFDWMYSTDHIGTTYKIKYGGTELEYLSPGARGIALLVLYLQMDDDDRRPLIIDQPEGNLDNSSIYQQLVPYIRKAKEKRQIILVTHNPNLVVATDAEQVIVATATRPGTQPYPCITYIAGSLEHSDAKGPYGIRQAVCTLLEGGERAFKEREGRYSIRQ